PHHTPPPRTAAGTTTANSVLKSLQPGHLGDWKFRWRRREERLQRPAVHAAHRGGSVVSGDCRPVRESGLFPVGRARRRRGRGGLHHVHAPPPKPPSPG